MELKDTVSLMLSDDYKERFKAEYAQLTIRTRKLQQMLADHEAGKLSFVPKTPIEKLNRQLSYMTNYLIVLKDRAIIEDIDLKDVVLE